MELFCDAVAVVSLLTLHLDPACYCKALKRICEHSQAAKWLNDGTGSHPALAVRSKLIDENWRSCKISPHLASAGVDTICQQSFTSVSIQNCNFRAN